MCQLYLNKVGKNFSLFLKCASFYYFSTMSSQGGLGGFR